MWAVFKRLPIAAPFDWNTQVFRRCLHGDGELCVQRPVPAHGTADERGKIGSVAGNVTTVERTCSPRCHKLFLTRKGTQPFRYREVDSANTDGAMHHPYQVRVYALELVE